MYIIHNPIFSLGVVFILSFFSARLTRKFRIPTITAYVALGILLSPDVFNLVSAKLFSASEFFSKVVLGIIAFSLGESFSLGTLRRVGKAVIGISISDSLFPWLLVVLATWLIFQQPFYIAFVLGAIAAATAPAAVVMVIQEYRSRGEFTDTLLGVVAIDDAWALIIFSLSLSLAQSLIDGVSSISDIVMDLSRVLLQIGGSFLLGGIGALIFNKLSHFIANVKERLIYTLGFLFLVISLASALNFSVLLSCMVFGAVLININKMNADFFNSLREIDSPLYIIFFVLAGASLKITVLGAALALTVGFIIFRTAGKIIGAFVGARVTASSSPIKKYMGLALTPQAGVALACALLAKYKLGEPWGDVILTVTVATTVIFELIGPLATKFALFKAGEVKE
ncbi:MAG: cation:proton antiporter [Candidatus Omnitrophota bacterium]|nr:MAG: cation:proton antiporter [Candidatus Omnitrophota bacterium]